MAAGARHQESVRVVIWTVGIPIDLITRNFAEIQEQIGFNFESTSMGIDHFDKPSAN